MLGFFFTGRRGNDDRRCGQERFYCLSGANPLNKSRAKLRCHNKFLDSSSRKDGIGHLYPPTTVAKDTPMNKPNVSEWIEDMPLYQQLKPCLLECPLEGQKKFLPLSDLNDKITRDTIKGQLPYLSTQMCHRNLPDKILQHAKKVFAILVFMGEPRAIKGLLQEGLTDEHLPLQTKKVNNHNVVESADGKIFKSFDAWGNEARVEEFLEKQWLVQAPVLDPTGKHIVLDSKCALPFKCIDQKAERGALSIVYKGTLHPAHQEGFKVSTAPPLGVYQVIDVKIRTAGGRS